MQRALDSLRRETLLAARSLRRDPAFSLSAVFSLGIALGAVALVVSVFSAAIVHALPGPVADRLVSVAQVRLGSSFRFGFSHEEAKSLPLQQLLLETSAYYRPAQTLSLIGQAPTQEMVLTPVSANFFDIFGIAPKAGRSFQPEDVHSNQPISLILTHNFWYSRLGGRASAVGAILLLAGTQYQVVGIMPADFQMPEGGIDGWIPDLETSTETAEVGQRLHRVIGLRRVGAPLVVSSRFPRAGLAPVKTETMLSIVSLRDAVVGPVGYFITIILGVVIVVLAIATLNVGILFLARNDARRIEFAVHLALGAGRWSLARRSWLEGSFLGTLGTLVGIGLALPSLRLLQAFGPAVVPRIGQARIDSSLLLLLAALVFIIGAVCSLITSYGVREMSSSRALGALRTGTFSIATRLTGQSAMVIGQIALALTLVTSATSLLQDLRRATTADLGLDTNGLLGIQFGSPKKFDRSFAFARNLLDEVAHMPTVTNVAITRSLRQPSFTMISADRSEGDWPAFWVAEQSASYKLFSTLGTPLLQGRAFTPEDEKPGPCRMVINKSLADAAWPAANPIGRRFDLAVDIVGARAGKRTGQNQLCEVIGVVGNTSLNPTREAGAQIYFPFARLDNGVHAFLIRTTARDSGLVKAVVDRAKVLDPTREVIWAGAVSDLAHDAISTSEFNAMVFGWLASLALLLTSGGVYGVLTQIVACRRREIGIRLAIGAGTDRVFRMIVGHAILLLGCGVVLGVAGAIVSHKLIESLLLDVTSGSLRSHLTAIAVMIVAGVAAALAPAMAAARVSPTELLRSN